MSNYADRAQARRASRGFRPPEGEYRLRFKEWSMPSSKSQKNLGESYFKLEFKVLEAPDADTKAKFEKNNRKLNCKFFPFVTYSFDDFLTLLEDFGADLFKLRSYEDDPDMEDLKALLDVAEKKSPDMTGTLKHQKDSDQYYNLYLKDVEKVLGGGNSAPVSTPSKPTGPSTPPAPNEPAEPVETPVYYLTDSGEVGEASRAEVQAHINEGYSDVVCVDGTNWISTEEAGFKKPEPKPEPKKEIPDGPSKPAKPATPPKPAGPSKPSTPVEEPKEEPKEEIIEEPVKETPSKPATPAAATPAGW